MYVYGKTIILCWGSDIECERKVNWHREKSPVFFYSAWFIRIALFNDYEVLKVAYTVQGRGGGTVCAGTLSQKK